MSKVKISKAIHNISTYSLIASAAVVNMSKVKISKAIHNLKKLEELRSNAVVNMSKVKISKAIHNRGLELYARRRLLSICQR